MSIRYAAWRVVFFAVNFCGALFVAGSCVYAICSPFAGGGSPYSFVYGALFIGPAVAFGVAEWCLYFRRIKRIERPLGVCGNGILLLFALNVAWCCWLRIDRRTLVEEYRGPIAYGIHP